MKKILLVLLLLCAVFGGVQVVSAFDAPLAADDQYHLFWDMCNPWIDPPIGVLQNDYAPNEFSLTAELVSDPQHGVLEYFRPDGSFYYIPDWYFLGNDHFTYRVYDGQAYSEPAWVTLTVFTSEGYNPIPKTTGDAYRMVADTVLDIPAPGVLGNDYYDLDEVMSAVCITTPDHGILSLNSDGSFTYTPDVGFAGTDSFLYVAENKYQPFWFSEYTLVTITVNKPSQTNVPEFSGMFVVICGIILGTACIAARMKIRR